MLTFFFEGRAFTGTADRPLGQEAIGNPALICFTETPLLESIMIRIAQLAASPMTTFLAPKGDGFAIRYFSPNGSEVDLCGHATLVSTYFLRNHVAGGSRFALALNPAFHSSRFPLVGLATPEGIGLSTRAYASTPVVPNLITDEMAQALGFAPEDVEAIYESELKDYLFLLRSNTVLRKATPDFDRVIEIGRTQFPHRALAIAAASDEAGFDYEARLFGPLLGLNEDIACGSVNCSLGPVWAKRLGRDRMRMFYCTPNEAGAPVVGGVQDILIEEERLTIRSNVRPVWSRVISTQNPQTLLQDEQFLDLMQRVGKSLGIKAARDPSVSMKAA